MITIERIAPIARQEHWIRIVLSDDTVIRTRDYVAADLGLSPGQELDGETLQRLKAAAGKASAKERAVRIISASSVSRQELAHRLIQKGEDPAHAHEAVDWLDDLQLLDGRKTAEQLVASAVRKGYGRARIRQILYEKRIPREYWEDVMADLPDMGNAVDNFLQKRFCGREPDQKERKRAVDALVRRGYSWQEIQQGLERYGLEREARWEEDDE